MPDIGMNVKVRRRTRTLKVKQLVDREDDGFELWRTRLDARLPAARQTWDEIAAELSLDIDAGRLEAASGLEEVIGALCGSAATAQCVDVMKDRTSFVDGSAQIELAEVIVAGLTLRSLAFESTDLSAARSLRSRVGERNLGPPENYVGLCREVAGGRP